MYEEFNKFSAIILNSKFVAIDTETDGFNKSILEGISICNEEYVRADFPIVGQYKFPIDKVLQLIAKIIDRRIPIVMHNVPYDINVLRFKGVEIHFEYPIFDTLTMSWLIHEEGSHALKDLVAGIFGYASKTYKQTKAHMQEAAIIYARSKLAEDDREEFLLRYIPYNNTNKTDWTTAVKSKINSVDTTEENPKHPDILMSEYAINDAKYTMELFQYYMPKIKALGLEKALINIEMPTKLISSEMSWHGIKLDILGCNKIDESIKSSIVLTLKKIHRYAGCDVNPGSPKQLNEVLFNNLGIDPRATSKGKNGLYSLNEYNMNVLAANSAHPILDEILKYRKLIKMSSTYSDKLPKLVDDDGYICAGFNSNGTVSGRFSCISSSTKIDVYVSNEAMLLTPPAINRLCGKHAVIVMTHNGNPLKVKRAFTKGHDLMYDVQADGKTIRCTGKHRFYTEKGWKRLNNLSVGDNVYIVSDNLAANIRCVDIGTDSRVTNGKGRGDNYIAGYNIFSSKPITSIEPRGEEVVWDLSVGGDKSYIAQGFVNHNSSGPNMQNIPRDDTLGKVAPGESFRKCFVANVSKGMTMIVTDLSQIELRLMAHFSKDKNMLDAYRLWNCRSCKSKGDSNKLLINCPKCGIERNERTIKDPDFKGFWHGLDIHQKTADKCACTRSKAKGVNFGLIYGMGVSTLCKSIDVKPSKADQIIDNFFDYYRGVKLYQSWIKRQIRDNGYITMFTGRRRRFDNYHSLKSYQREGAVREATNSSIQGPAADIMKIIIRNVRRDLDNPKFCLNKHNLESLSGHRGGIINQVHDEIAIECRKSDAEEISKLVQHRMTTPIELSVPFDCSLNIGDNWQEGK